MDSRARLSGLLGLAVAATVWAAPVQAQQGTITGQVTDAETGEPLSGAAVEALGQGGPQGTNDAGRFTLAVAPGTHSVVVTFIGHETTRVDGVSVGAGESTEVMITMRSQALVLNPIVITASRRQEKALDAPASIATVSSSEIARTAATTVADHVRTVAGIDAAQTGIGSGTLVARGFNNVFSGALLTIIDNRYARIPSLRFNAYSMFPTNDLDIDRIEVSLGPGAALYGPNAANGVMHVITPSPIDRPGTSISLAGGERSFFHGQFRSAHSVSDRFGLKFSGQYARGNDWEYVDPLEVVGRDYSVERYSADARMDFRFGDDGDLVINGGTSTIGSGVEMTGIGASQVDGWGYNYGQVRLSKGRLFAQAFLNQTDADEGTFLLRTNDPVVDQSRTMALQFQYGFDLGSWQGFTYGVDWQRTEPRSGGTIFGRNEDDDIITEIGTYLHSETSLGDKVDLVAAIRVDDHDRLTDVNISPRAAFVFKPTETQSFRLTFNRAFATPTSANLFLDIVAAQIPLDPLPLSYNIRALGVPDGGFTFSAQCPGGHMGYCMRSPFAPGQIPANALVLWEGILALLPSLDPGLALVVDFLKMRVPQGIRRSGPSSAPSTRPRPRPAAIPSRTAKRPSTASRTSPRPSTTPSKWDTRGCSETGSCWPRTPTTHASRTSSVRFESSLPTSSSTRRAFRPSSPGAWRHSSRRDCCRPRTLPRSWQRRPPFHWGPWCPIRWTTATFSSPTATSVQSTSSASICPLKSWPPTV